jgi:enhancer of mRNA-decapping protein 4
MLPGLQQTIEEAVEPGLNKLATGDLRETLQSLANAINDVRELSARNAELLQTLQSSPGARVGLQSSGSGLAEQHVTEAQLLQLLERDAYEQAFARALSERGAEAVRHLLQWIEPQGFFESGHGLSQIVMASLIHRVALDLQHDTPIKLDWLSHLLLHFHPMDPSIAAHSQHILHHTIHHLNGLLAAQPHHPLAINAKLLLHTANSLLSAPPTATPSFSSLPYGAPYM